MKRLAVLACVALAGCGGGDSARDVLAGTADHMKDIRSATVSLTLLMEPREGTKGRFGFALSGPVDLGDGGLPVARLRYTQYAGDQRGDATLTSTGRAAWVQPEGEPAVRLGAEQTAPLEQAARQLTGDGGLAVDDWIRDAEVSEEGETDHVTAELDPGVALRQVFAAMGDRAPRLDDDGVRELRKVVDEARLELWSGHEDRLLRRLRVRIGFKAAVPGNLKSTLGDLVGGRLRFDVDLSDLNRPVKVSPP
jgi:hypothetical protein